MEAKKIETYPEIESRVQEVISRTFGIPAEQVTSTLRMGGHPNWDSMGHMELITNLESQFGLRFPTIAVAELIGVAEIVDAIASKKYD